MRPSKQNVQRGYQHDYSRSVKSLFDVELRTRKAHTVFAVLEDYFSSKCDVAPVKQQVLNVGSSTGIVDDYLARKFAVVVGVDIDRPALAFAVQHCDTPNLFFVLGDAMRLPFTDGSFHVVVCAQVYEHVPNAEVLFSEIYRVLKPGGVCYLSANNRLMFNEPHYHLPLLSILPRPLAHWYLRLMRRGDFYHEKHYTYWGLKSLTKDFRVIDYTRALVNSPGRFGTSYMLKPGSTRSRIARIIVNYALWASPGYVWLLEKPK